MLSPFTALIVGVTGITKLTLAAGARPAAIVQVTTWPAAPQPAGIAPRVMPALIVSLIVATAVVAVVPVFCTVMV
ncbi:MAG: hypothetical protein IPH76_16325 [Xanthomonadales bacterium]|nr:hypothetical protein [Xanthomonadales bacterium]